MICLHLSLSNIRESSHEPASHSSPLYIAKPLSEESDTRGSSYSGQIIFFLPLKVFCEICPPFQVFFCGKTKFDPFKVIIKNDFI